MVRPLASSAPRWAAVSTPRARPLTTVTPRPPEVGAQPLRHPEPVGCPRGATRRSATPSASSGGGRREPAGTAAAGRSVGAGPGTRVVQEQHESRPTAAGQGGLLGATTRRQSKP